MRSRKTGHKLVIRRVHCIYTFYQQKLILRPSSCTRCKLLVIHCCCFTRCDWSTRHIEMRRLLRKKRSLWVKNRRTDAWWRNMINGISRADDWKRNFRMSREQFTELCEELRPFITPGKLPNYLALSVEKKVDITLYYLKDTTGSIWMTANTFGIHQCTRYQRLSLKFVQLYLLISPEYIHLPKTEDKVRAKVAEFETQFGMVQAFGSVDGTHIPIRRPVVDRIISTINDFSLSVYKQCGILKAISWT